MALTFHKQGGKGLSLSPRDVTGAWPPLPKDALTAWKDDPTPLLTPLHESRTRLLQLTQNLPKATRDLMLPSV